MEKIFNTVEVRIMANDLLQGWDNYKKEMHISPRSLYNLVAIKKALENEYKTISDTLVSMFTTHECPLNEKGDGFKIPEDKIDEMNVLMEEFSAQEVKIEYNPIILKDDDSIPSELIELLFDFIKFE